MKMMYVFLLLLLPFLINAHDKSNMTVIYGDISDFSIGTSIAQHNIILSKERIVTSRSISLPFFLLYSNGIAHLIAVENKIIKYIFVCHSIYSPNASNSPFLSYGEFCTPEGVFLGMNKKKVFEILPELSLREMHGWGYVAILPSGWKIVFTTGQALTDYFPSENDKVTIIYRD